MAKPKMLEEDRIDAGFRTRALILEIKQLSGLSAERLSEAFKNCRRGLDISGGLLRQYLTGNKPASLKRRKAIALAAEELGWNGRECRDTIYWASVTIDRGLRPGQVIYDAEDFAKRPIKRIEQDLDTLLGLGYDHLELLFIVAMKIKDLSVHHGHVDGAMSAIVSPADLPIEGFEHVDPVWMSVSFKPWHAFTPEDFNR